MLTVLRVYLVAGKAEGETPLNAFDNALLDAGIGDVNLVKVTSIIPPGVEVVVAKPKLPRGAFVPCVYAERVGERRGERIAVAVAVGQGEDGFGVVMECGGETEDEAREGAKRMVKEAFRVRGVPLKRLFHIATQHQVLRCGACVAACVFWGE